MKRMILTIVLTTLLLAGCNTIGHGSKWDNIQEDIYEQKVIVLDSVEDPLPEEAKDLNYMENTSEPQHLPNVNLSDPVVITKMPVTQQP